MATNHAGTKTGVNLDPKAIEKATKKATFKNFQHGAATIRRIAIGSIEQAPQGEPSDPGTPPNTHQGKYLTRSILFAVEDESAVIGTAHSKIGEAGAIHEHGEENHPERKFMEPALEEAAPRFGGDWQGSIGGDENVSFGE